MNTLSIWTHIDIIEILKIGTIGLGFLLALLSYFLIRKEQEKADPSRHFLRTIKLFMIFSIVVMTFGLSSEFLNSGGGLSLPLGDKKLNIRQISSAAITSINTDEYFINSEFSFAFKKPSKRWSKLETKRGLDGMFSLMDMKSTLFTKETLLDGVKTNPLGEMLMNCTIYNFGQAEEKTSVVVTDSSSNEYIENIVQLQLKRFADINDKLNVDMDDVQSKKDFQDYIRLLRRNLIGFDTAQVENQFALTIFQKRYLPPSMSTITLSGFWGVYSSMYKNLATKLVANENQILSGLEVTLNKVKIGSKIADFRAKKWTLMTENQENFFVIEILYYPLISSSTDYYDDLQETMNSFIMITNKS